MKASEGECSLKQCVFILFLFPGSLEDKKPLAIKDKAASSGSSNSSSFESSSHKDKPADVDVKTLQSRLATANASLKQKGKKIAAVEAEFERIFEALHHCQAELEQAKNTVKERDVLIGRLQAELAQGGCTCMRAVVFECTYKAVRAKQTKNIHQLLCTSKILR